MATYSSILACGYPWTEEPGGQQSIGSHRVGHNWSDLVHMHAREWENTNPENTKCKEAGKAVVKRGGNYDIINSNNRGGKKVFWNEK